MNSPFPDPNQMNIDAAFSNAEALFGQRRFEEAAQVYSNVLSALETQYGNEHPELAFPLQRLGDCFHALNRYRESLPLYLRLLAIGEGILGKTHPDMLNLMIKVAKTQELIGSFQESKGTFEAVLPLIQNSLGPTHELFTSTINEYELLNERITENKKAADAWRESSAASGSQTNIRKEQQGGPAVSTESSLPVPGGGLSIAVSDSQADDAAWENARAIPAGASGAQGPSSSAVFGADKSLPPVSNMPPLPTGPDNVASQPGISIEPNQNSSSAYTGTPVAQDDSGPDWSKSTRPQGGPAQVPPGNPPFPQGGPAQMPPGNSPFPQGGPAQMPPGNPPFPQGGPPQKPPGNSPFPQGGPSQMPPGNSPFPQGGPSQMPPGNSPFPPGGPSQIPPVNSVGPVAAIPTQDAIPRGDLGFEQRRNDPTNDPYVEHLATRVSELRPESEEDDLNLKSGAWHGSDVLKNLDISKIKGDPLEIDDYNDEFDDDDEEREEDKQIRSQNLKAARTAAAKSSVIVSFVRGVKEYLITLLAVSIFVVGGYYFFTNTEAVKPKLVSEKIVHDSALDERVHVFHTSDQALKLNLDGVKSCTLFHGQVGIKVPYNYYDGSLNMMALQTLDSLLERQHWFSEISEGMVTEQGVVFYSHNSPDWKVLTELRRLKVAGSNWFKVTGGYPSDLQKIPREHFSYVNAFTGVKENMKLTIIRYKQVKGTDLRSKILRGERIPGDGQIAKGQILGYTLMDSNNNRDMKSVAFYIRGVNSHGQYYQSSVPGEYLLVGYKGGVDDGNEHIPDEEAKLFRTEKPTKVWISKISQVPVFLIHHSLPVLLGVIGFFFIMRSMMLAPGQSPDNHLNRTLRMIGIIIVLANLVVIVVQFLLWR